jgi:acetyl esterase
MKKFYRKYFEPKYGPVSPEVILMPWSVLDFNNLTSSRSQIHLESILFLTRRWIEANCYWTLVSLRTENDFYERDGARIPVRVYRPNDAPTDGGTPAALPTIVYNHGGAFSMNNPDVYDQFLRALAHFANAIVVAPDYRLAPESKFPKGLEDAYMGLEWASENAEKFGGSADNIFIAGDSSGGNFAAAIALMARDRNGPKLRGQILIYPLAIFNPERRTKSEEVYGTGYFLEYNSQDKSVVSVYCDDLADSDGGYASPLLAESLKDLPKTLLFGAECDPLLDQELMYAARLEDEGNDISVKIYEGMIHAYINQPYKETFDTFKRISEFIWGQSS